MWRDMAIAANRAVLEVHLIKTLTDMYFDLNGIKSSSISPSTAYVLGKGNRKNVCYNFKLQLKKPQNKLII